jgi:hypothetical protein
MDVLFLVPTGERTSPAMLTCAAGWNARGGRILSAGALAEERIDRCAMALSENEKQALSALYGDVLQWEIDFHHAAYEE